MEWYGTVSTEQAAAVLLKRREAVACGAFVSHINSNSSLIKVIRAMFEKTTRFKRPIFKINTWSPLTESRLPARPTNTCRFDRHRAFNNFGCCASMSAWNLCSSLFQWCVFGVGVGVGVGMVLRATGALGSLLYSILKRKVLKSNVYAFQIRFFQGYWSYPMVSNVRSG